jgi:hypothetical protein
MGGLEHFVVKHIIFCCALRPGNLTLVECADGSFRVLRDERPLPKCRWESQDLDAAVTRFRELAAQFGRGPARKRQA